VTLSKLKPNKIVYSWFKRSSSYKLIELIAKKGYLKTSYEIEGKKISLINTHFYDSLDYDNVILKNQFSKIKRCVDEITIVSGDLNIPFNQLQEINRDYFTIDNGHSCTVSDNNPYQTKRFNKNKVSNKKIDYLLVKNIPGVEIHSETKVIKKPLLSDHYAVLSRVEITFLEQ